MTAKTANKKNDSMEGVSKLAHKVVPAVLLLSAFVQIILPAEADKGWLLYVARMVLQGRRLYADIIEVNPPLIIWFYEIPVWLSMHTSLKDFEWLGLIGVVLSLLSSGVCFLLMRLHPAFEGNRKEQFKFGLLILLIILFYNTQIYFFDRDHIFLVFAMPYLLGLMPGFDGRRIPLALRIVIGMMGIIGFCIKPHTIIVFIIVQLFTMLRLRSYASLWRLETLIIGAGAIVYGLCIQHFAPEYFATILPMAIATYSQFGNPSASYAYLPGAAVFGGLVFADFRIWHVTPYRRDVYYMLMLCFAFLGYALAQNGWGYTYNPLYCILLLATGWMMWEYLWLKKDHDARDLPSKRFGFGMRGCFLVFATQGMYMVAYLAVMVSSASTMRAPCEGEECWKSGPYTEYILKHNVHSFGTISLDFSNWVLMQRITKTRWDTRFNHLWMLPRLVKDAKEGKTDHRDILDYIGKAYAEDFNTRKPEIVLVDNSPGFIGKSPPLDYPKFLSAVPEFKAAWTHYRYAETLGECRPNISSDMVTSECKYDVFVRIP